MKTVTAASFLILFTLTLLLSSSAYAADWKINDPIVVNHDVEAVSGDALVLRVKIRFRDDSTPTSNTFTKDYRSAGLGAWDRIRAASFDDQDTLNEGELVPADGVSFVPVDLAPTPKEQAILDIQEAVSQACALEGYVDLFGKVGTDDIAGTTMNINGRRAALHAVIETNATTWAQVKNRMLNEWVGCEAGLRNDE